MRVERDRRELGRARRSDNSGRLEFGDRSSLERAKSVARCATKRGHSSGHLSASRRSVRSKDSWQAARGALSSSVSLRFRLEPGRGQEPDDLRPSSSAVAASAPRQTLRRLHRHFVSAEDRAPELPCSFFPAFSKAWPVACTALRAASSVLTAARWSALPVFCAARSTLSPARSPGPAAALSRWQPAASPNARPKMSARVTAGS